MRYLHYVERPDEVELVAEAFAIERQLTPQAALNDRRGRLASPAASSPPSAGYAT
jgi:hypothetical protein